MQRLWILSAFLCIALGINAIIYLLTPFPMETAQPFMSLWYISFLPYFILCLYVCRTKPSEGYWRRREILLILVGALLLRVILLPLPPNLSRDSWRYVWDARVALHGFSPYVYIPMDPALIHLRDFVLENAIHRGIPTPYPPVAQGVYILSYLIAPSNLYALKTIFMGFDLLSCFLLIQLLLRRGLDPARALIYAWCPLPIVEYAIQGHVDVIMITFSLLTVLAAISKRKGMRVMTGFWLAMATLSKIYPLIIVVAVLRKRDRTLLVTCFVTIVLAYIPFLLLGHGQIVGSFSSYLAEQSANGGMVQQIMAWIDRFINIDRNILLYTVYASSLCIVGGTSLAMFYLRLKERISIEAAIMFLTGSILFVSPHIYPWYVAALLPWIAVLVKPVWTRAGGLDAQGLAVAATWYFACMTIMGYFFYGWDWTPYHLTVYVVTLVLLGIAAGRYWQWYRKRSSVTRLEKSHL